MTVVTGTRPYVPNASRTRPNHRTMHTSRPVPGWVPPFRGGPSRAWTDVARLGRITVTDGTPIRPEHQSKKPVSPRLAGGPP